MKIAFSVDASLNIGTGRVMRCLCLADNLRKRGAASVFLRRDHVGNLHEVLRDQGYPIPSLGGIDVAPVAHADSGKIWQKVKVPVPPSALSSEINQLLFAAETGLMDFALEAFRRNQPAEQALDVEPTYYHKRTREDSRIDPHHSIADQFDLIRVCDPYRFPAFFEYRGERFTLKLEKLDDD